jgi:hypothetical protein
VSDYWPARRVVERVNVAGDVPIPFVMVSPSSSPPSLELARAASALGASML